MGLQIRDERQMKALTGLTQDQFASLLPVFSDVYRAAQQQRYEEGSQSSTRRRRPGGGSKGKLPTMVEKLQFVRDCSGATGFGMAPEGHLSYSAGLHMRARRTQLCSVRGRIDPIPPKG